MCTLSSRKKDTEAWAPISGNLLSMYNNNVRREPCGTHYKTPEGGYILNDDCTTLDTNPFLLYFKPGRRIGGKGICRVYIMVMQGRYIGSI